MSKRIVQISQILGTTSPVWKIATGLILIIGMGMVMVHAAMVWKYLVNWRKERRPNAD